MSISGVVDSLDPPNKLSGWVKDKSQGPNFKIRLELLHDGQVIGKTTSGQLRKDMEGDFGFSFEMEYAISGDDLMRGSLTVAAISQGGERIGLQLYSGLRDTLNRRGYSPYRKSGQKSRFCVFTSAGDNNKISLWSPQNRARDWDLIVAFYGENDLMFDEVCRVSNYAIKQKGGKFPNFYKILQNSPSVFADYEFIWLMDDDIIISPEDIQKCFKIARWFGFSVCTPSFNRQGKISFDIMRQSQDDELLRIVSFVETTCPLFKSDELFRFLRFYDGSLMSGYGIDYLYCHVLETEQFGRAAIIDAISVTNPHDNEKPGGTREIHRLIAKENIAQPWETYKRRAHIPEVQIKTFASVKLLSPKIFESD